MTQRFTVHQLLFVPLLGASCLLFSCGDDGEAAHRGPSIRRPEVLGEWSLDGESNPVYEVSVAHSSTCDSVTIMARYGNTRWEITIPESGSSPSGEQNVLHTAEIQQIIDRRAELYGLDGTLTFVGGDEPRMMFSGSAYQLYDPTRGIPEAAAPVEATLDVGLEAGELTCP